MLNIFFSEQDPDNILSLLLRANTNMVGRISKCLVCFERNKETEAATLKRPREGEYWEKHSEKTIKLDPDIKYEPDIKMVKTEME